MTTKELESKLKISENTCIHCSTLELAKQVLSIFHQLGLKWCNGITYTKCTDWDKYKENTIYYPFEGRFASLKHFQQLNGKIISAEEFIALHTEKEEFDLENYEPKGELTGFPKEIIARMLECQEEQGNKKDISVFERDKEANNQKKGFNWLKTQEGQVFWFKVIGHRIFNVFFEKYPKQDNQDNFQEFNLENYVPKGDLIGFPKEIIARMLDYQEEQGNKRDVTVFEKNILFGFIWDDTKEGGCFWYEVIIRENFDLFFEKYPKKEDNQEFKVGDKVIDIISGQIGKVTKIDTLNNDSYSILVDFNNNEIARFTLDGRYYNYDKYPRLLHYRDDYDYSVIDFNNLPKRQEQKMWRAKEEGVYHFVNFLTKGWFFSDESSDDYDCPIDNNNYNSGNYFRTEVEAEIIAQKLNTYFKQLIKEEHDN